MEPPPNLLTHSLSLAVHSTDDIFFGFRSADFTGNDVWLQLSKSAHPLSIEGLQQETNAYSYLVLSP